MYETYVHYALSTNDRGKTLAHQLSKYIDMKDKSYLDIGTAYGGYLVGFAGRGCRPSLGVEIDQNLIELCKINLRENGMDPDCVFQGDICEPLLESLKERKSDVITLNDVIEHVLDVSKAFENVKYLMAERGYLYLEIPNRYHVNNVFSDPHFGLFGITLLDRSGAIEYFRSEAGGIYAMGDYYNLGDLLSFFPKSHYEIKIINDHVSFHDVENRYQEITALYRVQIERSKATTEFKKKLKERFEAFFKKYEEEMAKRENDYFFIQTWKVLIFKR